MNKVIEHKQNAPAVQREQPSETAALFQMIERAARDPDVDIDKMQRLMEMREREHARVAAQQFNAAMAAAQAEMPQVVRDTDNDQTKSRYARYETISEAIQPIITKHGFALSFNQGETPKEHHLRILCDVMHRDGHTKQYHADLPIDDAGMHGKRNKTDTHAFGSTKSYGRRYLKCDIFDVAVKGEDDDGNTAGNGAPGNVTNGKGELISVDQRQQILKLIGETGADISKFCKYFKVEAVPDIPARKFADVIAMLEAKKATQ